MYFLRKTVGNNSARIPLPCSLSVPRKPERKKKRFRSKPEARMQEARGF